MDKQTKWLPLLIEAKKIPNIKSGQYSDVEDSYFLPDNEFLILELKLLKNEYRLLNFPKQKEVLKHQKRKYHLSKVFEV